MPSSGDKPHSFRCDEETWETMLMLTALRKETITGIILDKFREYLQEHGHLLHDAETHTCRRCGWTWVTGLEEDPREPGDWLCTSRNNCTRRIRQSAGASVRQAS